LINYPFKDGIQQLKKELLDHFSDSIRAITLFGSVARGYNNAGDVDILIIIAGNADKEKLRQEIIEKNNVVLETDIDFHFRDERSFSRLEFLHFGLAYDNIILHDPDEFLKKIITKTREIMDEWNTKRVFIDENDWMIYLKGEPVQENIELGMALI